MKNTDKDSNPLEQLRIWQRFHIRLTGLYGGAVFICLILTALFFYKISMNSELEHLQKRLLTIATNLADSINAEEIKEIPLVSNQITPFHERLLVRFQQTADRDPDIETIYILRPTFEPTNLRFLIDYVKDGKTGQPGELYDASDVPILLKGFKEPVVEDVPYTDEFGTTLSGYAPIFDKDGVSIALVGVDVNASRLEIIKNNILTITLVVFGIAALLIIIISLIVARSLHTPLTRIINATDAITKGELNSRIDMKRNDEFGLMSDYFDEMAKGLRDREFLRDTFGRYVSESVANTLLADGTCLTLGGEERIVTILFCDIRDYTTISEQMPPTKIVKMLNQYLEVMSNTIDEHHGCVIEFIGDAILAVFNAPNSVPDHSEKALLCAIEMREKLKELNEMWKTLDMADYWKRCGIDQITCRVGIHSGLVVAGNLGSPNRMKYSVIGDTVNVAARLEALNKELGTDILISDEVYSYLPITVRSKLSDHGTIKIKGREQAVHIYSA